MANPNPDCEKAVPYLEDLRVGQHFVSGTHRLDQEQGAPLPPREGHPGPPNSTSS